MNAQCDHKAGEDEEIQGVPVVFLVLDDAVQGEDEGELHRVRAEVVEEETDEDDLHQLVTFPWKLSYEWHAEENSNTYMPSE